MKDELFSIGSKIIEYAGKKGYDEAAVLVEKTDRGMVKIANSQPSITQRWIDHSLSMYLARNKRIFILSLHPDSFEDIESSLDDMFRYADVVEESMFYAPLPEPGSITRLEGLVDKNIFKYLDNPVELAEASIEPAHRERIDYIAGTIDLWYREKALITTKNAEFYEDSTGVQVYIRAFKEPDGSGQWSTCSTRIDKKSIEETASTAAKYAVESVNRESVEPGRYDLILSPLVFGNLVNLVARMSSAFSIFMGMSIFMKNKPGDKVASEKFSVYDVPHDTELPYATSFDDEGVATYNKPIIEDGVLKNILHNSKSADKIGVKSTGNAGWIYPHPWNLDVKPGDMSLDELISSVKKGLLITNNWYTRLQNYVEGIFSTISRDALFLIIDGKIVKPVEKIRIADKLPRLLDNIDGVGRDTYNIMWWEVTTPTRLPYVLVRDINVSKHML